MKLLKCHIENFGKLSNFDYNFENGLNTIKEENGFGKTTFASFIKAMFYGLESKRNTKLLIDRKKYQPWQGGAFGGSIEFELNDKKYKIERFFERKEADDSFKLYDLSTNLESNDYTLNIGEEIFKLNKEAYERSTFISGQNIETSMNDSINAKLGNILENENDINTSEQAIKVLEEAIKNYKKTGGRGEINEKILERTKLEQKLEQSKIDEKALQDRREKNNMLKQKLKERLEEQENLKKLLNLKIKEETKKAKLENYEILKNNVDEINQKIKNYEEFFKGEIPTDNEIETLIEKCLLLEKYRAEIKGYEISTLDSNEMEELKQLFQNKNISEEIINQKISECNSIKDIQNKIDLNTEKIYNLNKEEEILKSQKNKAKTINLIMCLCSVIFMILGAVTFVKQMKEIAIPSIIIGLLMLCVLIIYIVLFKKKKINHSEKERQLREVTILKENLEQEETQIRNDLEDFLKQYFLEHQNINNLSDNAIMLLTELKTKFIRYVGLLHTTNSVLEKQDETLKKLNELEDSIKNYLLKYFESVDKLYVSCAQEIKIRKNELERQKQDLEAKLKIKEEFEHINNINDLKENGQEIDIQKFDKNEIEEHIEILSNEINKISDEKNYNKNYINVLESNLDTVFDTENELEELNDKIDEMKENCDILEKTKKYLETAKDQFSSHYLNNMKQSFMKNLELINGSQIDVNLDVKLNAQINEQGSNKQINYFSTGYKDLIYICMRLSLIDCLFEEEKPFIILDDPFVNLDESKIKNATNLLNQLSKEYQIIYFICHESRK